MAGTKQMSQIDADDAHGLGSAAVRISRLQTEMGAVEMSIQIGRLVRLRRGMLNLSPEEVAYLAGVQPADVCRLELAESVPAYVAFQILAAMGLKCTAYDQ